MPGLLAVLLLLSSSLLTGEPLTLRVVAANLTSDQHQTYSPDNRNHSNPEGAGARILKALQPDIALLQEFNTSVPLRQWVNATFGQSFHVHREEPKGIPNGIVSRYPITASGQWDDPVLDNRSFAWVRIRLPGDRDLWAISVHFHSRTANTRLRQSAALLDAVKQQVPDDALVILGGDFNTRNTTEPCLKELARRFVVPEKLPHDGFGNTFTNKPRNRPYDWVIVSDPLERLAVPVKLAGVEFDGGLVFDSRVFEPLDQLPPIQEGDSGLEMMQHMAVVRDFSIPSSAKSSPDSASPSPPTPADASVSP